MAYTIAVIQNMQTIQFEQMQIALQTAQNQASIETPLRVEQFMTAHFNLAVLTDTSECGNQIDAPKTEASVGNPSPSTSTETQETFRKTPYRGKSDCNGTR